MTKLLPLILVSILLFPSCEREALIKKNDTKVLLIGIDGATWEIIDRLLGEGKLPTMKSLIDSGIRSPLETLKPTLSPAIWTTIVTGKLPNNHGILGFDGVPGLTMRTLPTSQMRKTKAVWNVISDIKGTIGFINWWCTWPAEKVRGFIVSDRATYNRMEASIKKEITTAYDTYPENLMTEIKHFIGKPDDITNEEIRSFMVLNDREIEKFIKTGSYQMGNYFLEFKYVYQSDKSVFKIGKYLLRKNAPDIFGIYFSGVDVVSHLYWHFMEPQYFKKHNISPDHILRFEKVIEHYYELVDQFIAGLLKVADSSYTIIIASDHGFGPTGNLPWSGGHGKITPGAPVAPDGILIINGNNIRKGEQLNNASVLDVLPTILYLFGMPLAKDFEGKVLLSAFDDNYQRKPQYIDSYDTIHSKISDAPLMGDPARDSDLLNKLKGLGYVE